LVPGVFLEHLHQLGIAGEETTLIIHDKDTFLDEGYHVLVDLKFRGAEFVGGTWSERAVIDGGMLHLAIGNGDHPVASTLDIDGGVKRFLQEEHPWT